MASLFPGDSVTSRGFTLAEFVIVTAVLAVLLGLAVPSAAELLTSVRLTSFSNALLFDLYLARSEAVKRNSRVVLCKSLDGETCATGGGWEQGLIVFHDINNSAVRETSEVLIHRGQALPGGFRLSGNLNVQDYVSYGPDGQSRSKGGAFQAGTFLLCRKSQDPTDARELVINSFGRPRIQRITTPSC